MDVPAYSSKTMSMYPISPTYSWTSIYISTWEQVEHNFFFFFRRERDGDEERCLETTKDLHRQSHDTVRKPKSFISDTKRETVDKS